MTDEEMREWSDKGLARLLAALVDADRIESALTAEEHNMHKLRQSGSTLALQTYNGKVN